MQASTTPKRRLGDFEIGREIGRGGMGIVYEARQLSLNRKVALKVLSVGLGLTSKAVVRFRREAEAAARLHHTNIVPIYATGEDDGTHFYAMELIEGLSLNVVIRRMRSGEPPEESAAKSDGLAPIDTSAMASLWLAETLPQDKTPAAASPATEASPVSDSSSGLTTGGGYFDTLARMIAEVADALDYAHDQGVIHRDIKPSNLLLSPAGRLSVNDFGLARMLEQPGMTTTGEFMGSPWYMSPEQITAGRAPLDHRTDIYSLGATLYELLTLQPPFPGERRDQVLAQIIGKEPKPPRKLNRKVPVDLETICLKALEKNPDRRYLTAGQMAEDLRRFVNRFAIGAKRTGLAGRAVKWIRRRPAVAALMALVLIVGGTAGLFAYSAHLSNLRTTEIQLEQAKEDAVLAAMSGQFDKAETYIQEAEKLGASHGWIRMLRGQVALHRNRPGEAIEHLEQALRLLPDSVAAKAMLTVAWGERGDWNRFQEMLADLEELIPVTFQDHLFMGWARCYDVSHHGLELLDEAIRQRPGSSVARLIRGDARWKLAMDTADLNDVEAALEDARTAKSMLQDNPVARYEHMMAQLVAANAYEEHQRESDHKKALAEAEEDSRALKDVVGVPLVHFYRGVCLQQLGHEDAALAEWRRGSKGPRIQNWVLESYAIALYRRGAFDQALRVLARLDEDRSDTSSAITRAYILTEQPKGPQRALEAYYDAAKRPTSPIMALFEQTTLRLLGRRAEAIRVCRNLREPFSRQPLSWLREWYQPLLEYGCDTLSAEELLKEAPPSRWKQCEFHYFIALNLLAEGDRAGAVEHFRNAIDTRVFYFFVYAWSRAFLERLENDPTWPPWIPLREDSAHQSKGRADD